MYKVVKLMSLVLIMNFSSQLKAENQASSIPTKPDLSSAAAVGDVLTVTFSVKKNEIIKKGKSRFNLIAVENHELDFSTSKLRTTNTASGESKEFCLAEKLVRKWKSELESMEVCDSISNQNDICAQVIIPAVAVIKTKSKVFELGSATDSCGRGMRQLCTKSMSDSFSGMTKKILNHTRTSKIVCKK